MQERILETEEITVEPGKTGTAHVEMQRVYIDGTGIPDYPETRRYNLALSKEMLSFQLAHIETDPDEVAPYFNVERVFFGADDQLDINDDGVSCEILNKQPAIKFRLASARLSICLVVRNTSECARKFKAKLVGADVQPVVPSEYRPFDPSKSF